jgi:hypothetical protein
LVTEVAITDTVRSAEGGGGAVKVTDPPLALDVGNTVPHEVAEQDTLHVTPALFGSFVTMAVNA